MAESTKQLHNVSTAKITTELLSTITSTYKHILL